MAAWVRPNSQWLQQPYSAAHSRLSPRARLRWRRRWRCRARRARCRASRATMGLRVCQELQPCSKLVVASMPTRVPVRRRGTMGRWALRRMTKYRLVQRSYEMRSLPVFCQWHKWPVRIPVLTERSMCDMATARCSK